MKATGKRGKAVTKDVWRPIRTAPREVWVWNRHVDLWLTVRASPLSFGISDAWRVPDCWRERGRGPWGHMYNGKFEPLVQDYITHWMRVPKPPKAIKEREHPR